jgi:uncharacterized protein HemX
MKRIFCVTLWITFFALLLPVMQETKTPNKESSAGPIAATVVVVLVLFVGGVYFFITQQERIRAQQTEASITFE